MGLVWQCWTLRPPPHDRCVDLRRLQRDGAAVGEMRRILVLGPPGSGKSTLARELGRRLDVPVFHLDQAFWRAGWVQAPARCFAAETERIAALPAWVIDGNYTDTIGVRLARADCVVYLDVPRWRCMVRLLRRIAAGHGRVRTDSAPGCAEGFDLEFLRFAWSWSRLRRARMLTLIHGFGGRRLVVRSEGERSLLLQDGL